MYIHAYSNKMFCFLCHFSDDAEEQYVWHILVHVCDFEFRSSIKSHVLYYSFVTCVSFQELQFSKKDHTGGEKVHQVGRVQIVSKIHVWGTKKVTFCGMLIDNFSCSSCSNYDEQNPWFSMAPRESSGDSEEHKYGPLDPAPWPMWPVEVSHIVLWNG